MALAQTWVWLLAGECAGDEWACRRQCPEPARRLPMNTSRLKSGRCAQGTQEVGRHMPGRRAIRALLPPQLGGMDGRAAAGGSAKDTGQQARSSAVTRKRTSKPQGGRATYLGAMGTHRDMELLCGREKVRPAVCMCVESSRQGVEAGGHVSHNGRDVGVHRVSGKGTGRPHG